MRRLLILAVTAALLAAMAAPAAGRQGPPGPPDGDYTNAKAAVCHYSEKSDSYFKVWLSQKGADKHLTADHGDGRPGDSVEGMDGYVFGEDCSLVVSAPCWTTPDESASIRFIGPINTFDNFEAFSEAGCAGTPEDIEGRYFAIIQGDTYEDVAAIYLALEPPFGDDFVCVTLNDGGLPDAPADFWLCFEQD